MQVSAILRRATTGYSFFCPGCEEMHVVYDTWEFNGSLTAPTWKPSLPITGKQIVMKPNSENWTGEWVRNPDGSAKDMRCHSFITDGQTQFLPDCTHALAGQTVPIPPLPQWLRDP